jgi:DNA-directed RNA polymerase specialized sigma24 family protein
MLVTSMQVRPSSNVNALAGDAAEPERLVRLVRRVARTDRAAFANLYDTLSPRISIQLRLMLPNQADAAAISSATFLEVWWLARFHVAHGTDVLRWAAGIAERRGAERWPAAEIHWAADIHKGAKELNHGVDTDRIRRWVAVNAIADRSAELALKWLLDPGTDPAPRPPLIARQRSMRSGERRNHTV